MIKESDRVFTNIDGRLGGSSLSEARKRGCWGKTAEYLKKTPRELLEEISRSNLRGRGLFARKTADKWAAFIKRPSAFKYLVVSANESEPGTCKARNILRYEAHRLLEGCLIASYICGIRRAYIFVRGAFAEETEILEKAIAEAKEAGLLGLNVLRTGVDLHVAVHRGAEAYVCRSDTAMFRAMEGFRPMPDFRPDAYSLFSGSVLVHGMETLCMLPSVLERGAAWFSSLGRADNEGVRLFSVSGDVKRPCLVEETLGVPMRDLIDKYAGGVIGGWDNLQAVIPGGVSTPALPAAICEHVRMDYDALESVSSSVGTGGLIVIGKSADFVGILKKIAFFFMNESCGECAPCREGCRLMYSLIDRIASGKGFVSDVDELESLCRDTEHTALCPVGISAVRAVSGFLRHFRFLLEERCRG